VGAKARALARLCSQLKRQIHTIVERKKIT
jgi:hypothetical protein